MIDIERRTITFGVRTLAFVMDEMQLGQLLSGGDEIGMTLALEPTVAAFETKNRHSPDQFQLEVLHEETLIQC